MICPFFTQQMQSRISIIFINIMSKNNSMEKFLSGSSLFKNQKNQTHASYITHQQYFSTLRGQRPTNSHFKYMSDVRQSPDGYQLKNSLGLNSKFGYKSKQNELIEQKGKQEEQCSEQIMKQKQENISFTASNLIPNVQNRQKKNIQIAVSPIRNQEQEKQRKQMLDSNIKDSQGPQFIKTNSQKIQVLQTQRKDKSRYQHLDLSNINIVIAPSPSPKAYVGERQIIDKFTPANQQQFAQPSPEQRNDFRTTKTQNKRQTSSILRSQLSDLNYSNQSSPPYEINSYSRSRKFNYGQMQSHDKSSSKFQETKKNQLEEISLKNKNYRNQRSQRQKLPNKDYKFQEISSRFNFFATTHRQASNYIQSIENQLREAFYSLQNIQADIDRIIHTNLQLQCEKIRNSLLRVIESGISRFKATQRMLLERNKIIFIAELYEIKSNIELRRSQIQNFRSTFEQKRQWKHTVRQLLVPDFQQNVSFLLNKSEEIGFEWLGNTNLFLSKYNKQIVQNCHGYLKKEINSVFGQALNIFTLKNLQRDEKKQRISRQT